MAGCARGAARFRDLGGCGRRIDVAIPPGLPPREEKREELHHIVGEAPLAARIAGLWPADGYCLLVNWLGPTEEALQGEEAARLFLARLAAHAGPLDHTSGGGTGYRIDLACLAGCLSRERSLCGDSAEIPDAAGDPGYPAPPDVGRDG